MRHTFLLISLQFVFAAACIAQQPSEPIYVGLIEYDRRQLAKLGSEDFDLVPNRTITPAFVRDRSGWKPVQKLSEKVKWTVAFDGKNLGEVESEVIPATLARPVGHPGDIVSGPVCVHSINTPADKVPVAGKSGGPFSGNYGANVRRPPVVVSRPNFTDPDHWKRAVLPDELLARVRTIFKKTFDHIRYRDSAGESLKQDSSVPDSEILVVKTYGSNKNTFLVQTQLKKQMCVFNLKQNQLQLLEGTQWHYVAAKCGVVFLGRDWELIDAGDYDGDGKSEVIFYIAKSEDDVEIDVEGYALFF